jgi:hypothetical protein
MPGADDDALQRAERERDRMLARMTFWEHWRGTLMLPLIAIGGAIGLGIGYAIETALHWPDRTRFFGAVIGILLIGRFVTAFFDASKLDVARRRVQQLSGKRNSRG